MSRPPFVILKESLQARGHGVHLLLDLSSNAMEMRKLYAVALTLDRNIFGLTEPLDMVHALERYDAYALWSWGPRGESTLNAVLRRCRNEPREDGGVWQGSIGEFAARQYPIGTWEWLEVLRAYRDIDRQFQSRRAA